MENNLYIGNYGENGIDILKINAKLVYESKLGSNKNTSYIVKNKNFLYSVIEIADKDTNSGYVVSYNLINGKVINLEKTWGEDPCFLNIDQLRNILYVCNYTRRFYSCL